MSRGLGGPRNALALQNAYHNATVLRLSFGCLIVLHLMGLAHCARRKHPREGNVRLLKQDVCHVIRALLTEFVVQGNAAGRRGACALAVS